MRITELTVEQINTVLIELEKKIKELENENKKLKEKIDG